MEIICRRTYGDANLLEVLTLCTASEAGEANWPSYAVMRAAGYTVCGIIDAGGKIC